MALRYVLDENLRGPFWQALQRECARAVPRVEVTRVGDPADLPLGTTDRDLLLWAEREGRVIVTIDYQTMPGHHADHLASGRHSCGVFILRPHQPWPVLLRELVTRAQTTDPAEVQDLVTFIP
jgi:Domain of unknown function (DUF5615)